ncbi:hypothetical protein PC129_g114 [Phytophthora cactorum]|uniref:C2H2-type domain-containing protein n=1 Tax=Phytophthora cactorum TaxID=29920 RepID=A0A329T2P1_9STRA|nr:hypothetical protein Pcac1_g210 [Phytophthora cactorum]KAG2820932.1 hypothetical protein PC112_g11577 [Phytophthora cactorum]KAG2848384.1 hypothetical protein PC111_g411 [Phytophthora cactorum]KAG2868769.1 hypothetical protein PC113_g758 [Phytophthora cactorum]KAG2944086.1 hypothetical protein PC115_g451 [Phytophthora cactorum]
MATEEAGSNPPGPVTAQRPLQDLFPVRHVLGMLQRNERLSEQPAPVASAKAHNEHQENHNGNKQANTIQNEEIVSESPPSQPDESSQELNPDKGGNPSEVSCPKCGRGFSSATSLRTHLDNVYPCNESRPAMSPREGRFESKTCFKCGKTFASWQGLRGHLNRIKPCDQEKPAPATTTRRRPAASRTCTKCGKTFSSPQSLRIHMNRVKPCDQDTPAPTTPPATASPSTPLMMNTEDLKKEAERKAKARYQARKAYLKKRGRLDELGDPPSPYNQASHYPRGVEEAAPKPDLKRHASDEPSHEGDNLESSNTEVKKQRVQEEQSQDDESANSPSDVSTLTTEPNMPAPPIPEPPKKTVTAEGSFIHRSNKDHGGDLLAGGCSCPPCVRRWARKLMNRMQQLEDEVVLLRQKKYGGESATTTDGASTNTPIAQVVSDPPTQDQSAVLNNSLLEKKSDVVASHSQAKPANIFRSLASSTDMAITSQRPEDGSVGRNFSSISARIDRPSSCKARREDFSRADGQQQCPTASGLQGLGSDKRSLMDAYTHMNDQILMNERVVEESNGHAEFLVGCNPDFRRQVDELRVSISTEKSKREITVAALIAREWKPRRDEFKALLENRPAQNSHHDEQAFHAKWSQISSQASAKDKVIAELEKRMDSLGESGESNRSRYAEMGELSSKMAAEYAAKMALEGDRGGVYVGLVKASTRIRSLVKNALL